MNIWMSKVTSRAIILVAALGLILSPTVDLANPAANNKRHHTQVVRHPARQTVQFQEQEASTPDWAYDADGFYTPTRSPGFNELLH
jgi:hypothetical protein